MNIEDYADVKQRDDNEMSQYFSQIQENLSNQDVDELKNMIQQQKGNIDSLSDKIKEKDEELRQKMERSVLQQREIDYKKKLITTRNRMLELSQEKNIYKTKVIYTLFATVLAITIFLLATYVYYKRM
jgi:hypothetical protein